MKEGVRIPTAINFVNLGGVTTKLQYAVIASVDMLSKFLFYLNRVSFPFSNLYLCRCHRYSSLHSDTSIGFCCKRKKGLLQRNINVGL